MEKKHKEDEWHIHYVLWGKFTQPTVSKCSHSPISPAPPRYLIWHLTMCFLSGIFGRSAALNFAHVATGQLDMYQEIGCWRYVHYIVVTSLEGESRPFTLIIRRFISWCMSSLWLFDATQLGCMRWCSHCTRSRRQGELSKSFKHQQTGLRAYARLQFQSVYTRLTILRSSWPLCSHTHSLILSPPSPILHCTHAGGLIQFTWNPGLRPTWRNLRFKSSNGTSFLCHSSNRRKWKRKWRRNTR